MTTPTQPTRDDRLACYRVLFGKDCREDSPFFAWVETGVGTWTDQTWDPNRVAQAIHDARVAGGAAERADVVAWLRVGVPEKSANWDFADKLRVSDADGIERGEHEGASK